MRGSPVNALNDNGTLATSTNSASGFQSPLPGLQEPEGWYISSSGRVRAAAVAAQEERAVCSEGAPRSSTALCFDARESLSVGLTPLSAAARGPKHHINVDTPGDEGGGNVDTSFSSALEDRFREAGPGSPVANLGAPNCMDRTPPGSCSSMSGVALSNASTPLPELSPDQAASMFADALEESAHTNAASWRRARCDEGACSPDSVEDAASPRHIRSDGSAEVGRNAPSSPSVKHGTSQEAAVMSLSEQERIPPGPSEEGTDSPCVSLSGSDGSPVVAQSVLRTRRKGRFMVDDEDESPARPSSPTGCASGSQGELSIAQ